MSQSTSFHHLSAVRRLLRSWPPTAPIPSVRPLFATASLVSSRRHRSDSGNYGEFVQKSGASATSRVLRSLSGASDVQKAGTGLVAIETFLQEEDIVTLQLRSIDVMADPRTELSQAEVAARQFPLPPRSTMDEVRAALGMGGPDPRDAGLALQLLELVREPREGEEVPALSRDPSQPSPTEIPAGPGLKLHFEVGGPNREIFWCALHQWLLLRRLQLEMEDGESGKKRLRKAFMSCIKDAFSHEGIDFFDEERELNNAFDMCKGFMMSLDAAFAEPSVAPALVERTLWQSIYSSEVPDNDEVLRDLTKYVLRSVSFILQVDRDVFLSGQFEWPAWPVSAGDAA